MRFLGLDSFKWLLSGLTGHRNLPSVINIRQSPSSTYTHGLIHIYTTSAHVHKHDTRTDNMTVYKQFGDFYCACVLASCTGLNVIQPFHKAQNERKTGALPAYRCGVYDAAQHAVCSSPTPLLSAMLFLFLTFALFYPSLAFYVFSLARVVHVSFSLCL